MVRLREVRALRGFTRILRASRESSRKTRGTWQRSIKGEKNWLPAIEVKGEGIFLRFNAMRLTRWEQKARWEPVDWRRGQVLVNMAHREAWMEIAYRDGKTAAPEDHASVSAGAFLRPRPNAAADAIVRGYSNASLRERLYVVDNMTGLMIYTGTTDSDGSLGGAGTTRGKRGRTNELLPAAIPDMQWCSNDPLCIEDISTFSDCAKLGGLSFRA